MRFIDNDDRTLGGNRRSIIVGEQPRLEGSAQHTTQLRVEITLEHNVLREPPQDRGVCLGFGQSGAIVASATRAASNIA
jgi:hypothetical protein